MSPAQLAQIRLRLDQVAQQRAKADQDQAARILATSPAAIYVTPKHLLPKTKKARDAALAAVLAVGAQPVGPATQKALETMLPKARKAAGNGRNAKKQAAYRTRKGEAGKATDAARKRASRAKGA